MDDLLTFVTVLIPLSIASERLVEIIKGWIPALNEMQPSDSDTNIPFTKIAYTEGRRKAILQILAVVAGILTAWIGQSAIAEVAPAIAGTGPWGVLALGLLASGGSGLWNSVLTYILQIKELKTITVEKYRSDLLKSSKTG